MSTISIDHLRNPGREVQQANLYVDVNATKSIFTKPPSAINKVPVTVSQYANIVLRNKDFDPRNINTRTVLKLITSGYEFSMRDSKYLLYVTARAIGLFKGVDYNKLRKKALLEAVDNVDINKVIDTLNFDIFVQEEAIADLNIPRSISGLGLKAVSLSSIAYVSESRFMYLVEITRRFVTRFINAFGDAVVRGFQRRPNATIYMNFAIGTPHNNFKQVNSISSPTFVNFMQAPNSQKKELLELELLDVLGEILDNIDFGTNSDSYIAGIKTVTLDILFPDPTFGGARKCYAELNEENRRECFYDVPVENDLCLIAAVTIAAHIKVQDVLIHSGALRPEAKIVDMAEFAANEPQVKRVTGLLYWHLLKAMVVKPVVAGGFTLYDLFNIENYLEIYTPVYTYYEERQTVKNVPYYVYDSKYATKLTAPLFYYQSKHFCAVRPGKMNKLMSNGNSTYCIRGNHVNCKKQGMCKPAVIMGNDDMCQVCKSNTCDTRTPGFLPSKNDKIKCFSCGISCFSESCSAMHSLICRTTASTVDDKSHCPECGFKFTFRVVGKELKANLHKCYKSTCPKCHEKHDLRYDGVNGICKFTNPGTTTKKQTYIAFDLETDQESGTHIPNYAVAIIFNILHKAEGPEPCELFRATFKWKYDDNDQAVIDRFLRQNDERHPSEKLSNEAIQEQVKSHITTHNFRSGNPMSMHLVDELCFWLLTQREDMLAIAHYGKGFDFQFVREFLVRNAKRFTTDYTQNGSKIMRMSVIDNDFVSNFVKESRAVKKEATQKAKPKKAKRGLWYDYNIPEESLKSDYVNHVPVDMDALTKDIEAAVNDDSRPLDDALSLAIKACEDEAAKVKPKPKIVFIDSINHISLPLSGFIKAFSIPDKFAKGHFPHYFNKLCNWNYVGPLPDISYYDPDSVKDTVHNKTHMNTHKVNLYKWYHEEQIIKGDSWDFKKEMHKYCTSDVELLMHGIVAYYGACQTAVKTIDPNSAFNPWDYATLASSAMNIQRKFCIKGDELMADDDARQSYMEYFTNCCRYYTALANKNPNVTYNPTEDPLNYGGMDPAVPFPTTGVCMERYEDALGTTFSKYHLLLSCHFHGCPSCRPQDGGSYFTSGAARTPKSCNQHAMALIRPDNNFDTFVHWEYECKVKGLINEVPEEEFRTFITRDNIFFGGRTAPTKLMVTEFDGEKIDVTSLYPSRLWNCPFPMGTPDIFTAPFNSKKSPMCNPAMDWTPEALTREIKRPIQTSDYNSFVYHVANGGTPESYKAGTKAKFTSIAEISSTDNYEAFYKAYNDTKDFYDEDGIYVIRSKANPANIDKPKKCLYEYLRGCPAAVAFMKKYGVKYVSGQTLDDVKPSNKLPTIRDEIGFKHNFVSFTDGDFRYIEALYNMYVDWFTKTYGYGPHLHEVLNKDTFQCVRFDIDFCKGMLIPADEVYQFMTHIMQAVYDVIVEKYPGMLDYIQEAPADRHPFNAVRVSESCSPNKSSFHLITYVIGNADSCNEFSKQVYANMAGKKTPHPFLKYLDMGVHKKNQSLRLFGCSKNTDPERVKRFYNIFPQYSIEGDFDVEPIMIDSNVRNNIGLEMIASHTRIDYTENRSSLMHSSFIGYYLSSFDRYFDMGLKYFGSNEPDQAFYAQLPKKEYIRINKSNHTLGTGVIDLLRKENALFDSQWTFKKQSGTVYTFQRLMPTYCDICDRTHESDNTMYAYNNFKGDVFRKCYKNPTTKAVHVGNYKMATDDIVILESPKPKNEEPSDAFKLESKASSVTYKTYKLKETFVRPTKKTYSYFDICSGQFVDLLPVMAAYIKLHHSDQFKLVNLSLTDKERQFYTNFYKRDWNSKESLISARVRITPPDNMLHPILPRRKDEKCLFDLEERVGSYCFPELRAALYNGYVITQVFEVSYHKKSDRKFFQKYIMPMMAIKQVASGIRENIVDLKTGVITDNKTGKVVPNNTITSKTDLTLLNLDDCAIDEAKLDKYIETTFKKTKILLPKKLILETKGFSNEGLRLVSKAYLNSLWGKFGENHDKTHYRVFCNEAELIKFETDRRVDRHSVRLDVVPNSENTEISAIIANYKNSFGEITTNNYTNYYIAAYTTSHARLYLWKKLHKLGDRVAYYDTDSIVYKANTGPNIVTGNSLGEWDSEIDNNIYKPSDKCKNFITDFYSIAPKSMAYKISYSFSKYQKMMGSLGYEVLFPVHGETTVYHYMKSGSLVKVYKTIAEADSELSKVPGTLINIFTRSRSKNLCFIKFEMFASEYKANVVNNPDLKRQYKCIAIELSSDYSFIKHKGVILNMTTKFQLNYEKFVEAVTEQCKHIIRSKLQVVPNNRFTWQTPNSTMFSVNKKSRHITVNVDYNKIFQLTFDKGYLLIKHEGERVTEVSTRPFGFNKDLLYRGDWLVFDPRLLTGIVRPKFD